MIKEYSIDLNNETMEFKSNGYPTLKVKMGDIYIRNKQTNIESKIRFPIDEIIKTFMNYREDYDWKILEWDILKDNVD